MADGQSFREILTRHLKTQKRTMGRTQEEIAQAADISPSLLTKLKSGDRPPTPDVVERLAEQLRLGEEERESFCEAAHRAYVEHLSEPGNSHPAHRLKSLKPLPERRPLVVGRDNDIQGIWPLLNERGAIINIVGEPGIGKTTLAIEFVNLMYEKRWVVIWGEAREGEARTRGGIESLIWRSLLDKEIPRDPMQRLKGLRAALGKRHTLLALDNMESADDMKQILELLIEIAPATSILLTSRRRIPPSIGRNIALSELEDDDSVTLFERVGVGHERYVETAEDRTIIELICQDYLHGHPGAIEIVAALWLSRPLREILRGLDDKDKAMDTMEDDDGSLRSKVQRSMRLSIGLSYDLLHKDNPEASTLFPRLSVFQASFQHFAAEEICEIADPFRALGFLVQRSLVRFDRDRYTLHTVIQKYASAKLGADRKYYETRAAWYFFAYAQRHARDFDALERENGNLLATMEWCDQDQEHQELGPRLVVLLDDFMNQRGYWEERLARAEKALLIAELLDDRERIIRLKLTIADTHRNLGDHEKAIPLLNQVLDMGRADWDQQSAGMALFRLAEIAHRDLKEPETARQRAVEAVQAFEAPQDNDRLPFTYSLLVDIERGAGNPKEALRWARKELAIVQAKATPRLLILAYFDLFFAALESGDYEQAENRLESYQAVVEKDDDPATELGRLHTYKALLASRRQEPAQANEHLLTALSHHEQAGNPWEIAQALRRLAQLSLEQGDLPVAEKHISRYVTVTRPLGNRRETASGLVELGKMQSQLGKSKEARASFGEALALYEESEMSHTEEAGEVRSLLRSLGHDGDSGE